MRSNMFSGLGRGIRRSCKYCMEIGVVCSLTKIFSLFVLTKLNHIVIFPLSLRAYGSKSVICNSSF